MSEVIVVAGQSGVGKDFLVNLAEPEIQGITHANWGDIFSDIVKQDKDLLTQYIPDAEETGLIQAHVIDRVLEMQPVIVTSHPVKIEQGIEYVNWDIEKKLNPSDYVFVKANPSTIFERVRARNIQGLRRTPELTVENIERMQQRKLELISELAHYVAATLTVIDNENDGVDENVAIIRNVMRSAVASNNVRK